MAKYRCDVCGYLFDEQQAGETFDNIYSCPICDSDKDSLAMEWMGTASVSWTWHLCPNRPR